MEKTCKSCNVIKHINEFKKTSNGYGVYGVGATCKECRKIKDKLYRDSNKETIKKKRDEIYQNDESRLKIREYQKKY
jgi:hypothetical protein